jgi:peptidoglycan hydrolase-like protein with peptidoglycan-binding domain
MKKLILSISILAIAGMTVLAQPSTTTTATKTSTSSTTKSHTPSFRPTKDQVKQGQEILIQQKLYSGQATGVYGDSRSAIKAYQKANGLEQTGKFDRATLDKMGIALTDSQKGIPATSTTSSKSSSKTRASADGPKRPAPFQASADQIKMVQQKLKDAKLFDGDADGKRSDALKLAVTKYQQANGLNATGGINAATLDKIGIALTDGQKANVAAQTAYDASKKN